MPRTPLLILLLWLGITYKRQTTLYQVYGKILRKNIWTKNLPLLLLDFVLGFCFLALLYSDCFMKDEIASSLPSNMTLSKEETALSAASLLTRHTTAYPLHFPPIITIIHAVNAKTSDSMQDSLGMEGEAINRFHYCSSYKRKHEQIDGNRWFPVDLGCRQPAPIYSKIVTKFHHMKVQHTSYFFFNVRYFMSITSWHLGIVISYFCPAGGLQSLRFRCQQTVQSHCLCSLWMEGFAV